MYQYKCMNQIAKFGLDHFTRDYAEVEEIEEADALLVRSAALHDMEFPKNLKTIARAGAGVNNIPLGKCAEQGIVVFNTPGANANGVKELVLAGLLLAARDIIGGVNWVQSERMNEEISKLAEKQKKQFPHSWRRIRCWQPRCPRKRCFHWKPRCCSLPEPSMPEQRHKTSIRIFS